MSLLTPLAYAMGLVRTDPDTGETYVGPNRVDDHWDDARIDWSDPVLTGPVLDDDDDEDDDWGDE